MSSGKLEMNLSLRQGRSFDALTNNLRAEQEVGRVVTSGQQLTAALLAQNRTVPRERHAGVPAGEVAALQA